MFVSVVLNVEYMDIASRSKWYLKNLYHCKENNWILISHESLGSNIAQLQNEINPGLFDSWEIPPFTIQDISNVEQYFLPDNLFLNCEEDLSSRTEFLFDQDSDFSRSLESYFENIIRSILQKHPNEKIDGILHCLESFSALNKVCKKYRIPLIKYSFSAIRKPHGYRHTLYQVNSDVQYFSSEECRKRYEKFKGEKQVSLPIFSNKEILAILGKERNLPLLCMIDSDPEFDIGVCCDCFALQPSVFKKIKYTDDDLIYEAKQRYPRNKIKVRSHSIHLDDIQINRDEIRNDPASFILSCKRLSSISSQILLKSILWGRIPIMKADSLGFSFLCAKDYIDNYTITPQQISYYIFGYLVPEGLMFSKDYWYWRITNPSETEIYLCHLNYILSQLDIKIDVNHNYNRLYSILKSRGTDKQLLNSISNVIVPKVNWNALCSKVKIVFEDGFEKNYWRINEYDESTGIHSFNLNIEFLESKRIKYLYVYPLDDVAGFIKVEGVLINEQEYSTNSIWRYMKKNQGKELFYLRNSPLIQLNLLFKWSYKTIQQYLEIMK